MPGRSSRWITVERPFDYHWPGRAAVTAFRKDHLGEHLVKNEVADFAVANGYACEGKRNPAARSNKGGGRKVRSKKEAKPVDSADTGTVASMGDADTADADRPADRPPVDSDAG